MNKIYSVQIAGKTKTGLRVYAIGKKFFVLPMFVALCKRRNQLYLAIKSKHFSERTERLVEPIDERHLLEALSELCEILDEKDSLFTSAGFSFDSLRPASLVIREHKPQLRVKERHRYLTGNRPYIDLSGYEDPDEAGNKIQAGLFEQHRKSIRGKPEMFTCIFDRVPDFITFNI